MLITLLGCQIRRRDAVALYAERRLTTMSVVGTPWGFSIDLGKGRKLEAWGTKEETDLLIIDMQVAGMLARDAEHEDA